MKLKTLTLLNYRNISEASLALSPNVNCIVGRNGMGKTNVLDAVFYLSFCKSSNASTDAQNILHDADFFMLRGEYEREDGGHEQIDISIKRGGRKRIRHGEKEYRKLSEHLGRIPLVMIAPSDEYLVGGGAEERRKFMDMVIAQYDSRYVESLIRYEQSLKQRNALLKQESGFDADVMNVVEEMMSMDADYIYNCRTLFANDFLPLFQELYHKLCDGATEGVSIEYTSHISRGALKQQLESFREKERIVGYTLHGTHRDDLTLLLSNQPLKYEGSQGQRKTYVIAMKLAQFLFLRKRGRGSMPILLLDDIFDKLDAGRVAKIVDYVASDDLGQIFITDTNREHIDQLLARTKKDYKLFYVHEGNITENNGTP